MAVPTPPSDQFPNVITDAMRISLNAAQEPEVLLTGPDTVIVMAFYDQTGADWPIASYVFGRPSSFQVYVMQEGSNRLAVTPLVPHGFINIIVSLVGESRPLIFEVPRTRSTHTTAVISLPMHWVRTWRQRHCKLVKANRLPAPPKT